MLRRRTRKAVPKRDVWTIFERELENEDPV